MSENNTDALLQQKDINYLTKEVEALKQTLTQGLNSINTKLEVMSDHYVKREEMNEKIKPLREDLDEVKANLTWGIRIVIGAVILAILGLVLISK